MAPPRDRQDQPQRPLRPLAPKPSSANPSQGSAAQRPSEQPGPSRYGLPVVGQTFGYGGRQQELSVSGPNQAHSQTYMSTLNTPQGPYESPYRAVVAHRDRDTPSSALGQRQQPVALTRDTQVRDPADPHVVQHRSDWATATPRTKGKASSYAGRLLPVALSADDGLAERRRMDLSQLSPDQQAERVRLQLKARGRTLELAFSAEDRLEEGRGMDLSQLTQAERLERRRLLRSSNPLPIARFAGDGLEENMRMDMSELTEAQRNERALLQASIHNRRARSKR